MSSANHLRAFMEVLAYDRRLVVEMEKILRRAQMINVDFHETARRRLRQRVQQLVWNIEREARALREIDLFAADLWVVREKSLILGGSLFCAREGTRSFERVLERVSILDVDREPGLGYLAKVSEALDDSLTVATELARILGTQPPMRESVRRSPLRASRRIANLAARLLPWEERQRYLHEYLSELHDLAQDEKLSGQAQLAYALRLLARTPALIFALRRRTESGLITSRPET